MTELCEHSVVYIPGLCVLSEYQVEASSRSRNSVLASRTHVENAENAQVRDRSWRASLMLTFDIANFP